MLGKKAESDKKITYLKYAIAFILISIFFAYIYTKCGRSFLHGGDSTTQHIVALGYLQQYIKEFFGNLLNGVFSLPSYDLSIGQGANIYTTLTYYGFTNPLYWLIGLFPTENVYKGYVFLYFLQLYLSGCSFIYFAHTFENCREQTCWIAAIIYCFQSFTLENALRHPFFLTGMIYLPLMLAFSIKTSRNKSNGKWLSVWTALCVLASFYFAYVNIILTFLCAFIYNAATYETELEEVKRKRFKYLSGRRFVFATKSAAQTAFWMIGGLLLSSPILVPVIKAYLNTYRSVQESGLTLFYDADFYKGYVRALFYLPSTLKVSGIYMGVFGACVASVVAVFTRKNREFKAVRSIILVMAVMTIFPIFGSALNGFSYATVYAY